jgi:CheY-like chemotaxis protein
MSDNGQAAGDTRPPHVLLADDDPSIRKMLRSALEAVGYQVTLAASTEEALPVLEAGCPDALIADLVMPGLSGAELARRCHERCPNTILVFMSGFPPEQLRTLGVTQVVYLNKPISITELRALLKQRLGR